MKHAVSICIFAAGIITGIVLLGVFAFGDKDGPKPYVQNVADQKGWYAPPLPKTMEFAGEPVPLDRWEVKEQLDREILFNYYWQNNILYMMKLSSRYFPAIESTLKSNGIPEDFKYLCVAESNMLQATSRSGAVGFWQLMKGTAPGYNIEVSETVDERFNITRSTEAACKYLRQAYDRFGNWTAAAASYNCGMAGFNDRAIYQGSKNYYDLILPDETQRYIFRILAFKYLLSNSDSLGFTLRADERYQPIPVRMIVVNKNIPDLARFAKEQNSDYKMLKWLNPWLRARSLTARPGKRYEILLPQ